MSDATWILLGLFRMLFAPARAPLAGCPNGHQKAACVVSGLRVPRCPICLSPTAPGCPTVPGLASGHPSVWTLSRTAASPAHAQILQVQGNAFRVCDALRLCASDVPSIPPSRVWPTNIPSETPNTLNRVSGSYGPAPGPTSTTSALLLRIWVGLSKDSPRGVLYRPRRQGT